MGGTWQDLTMMARDMLCRPHDESGFGVSVLLQILCRQAFHETRCWCICKTGHDESHYPVIINTWLSSEDYPDVELIEEETGFEPGTVEFQDAFRNRLPQVPTIRETKGLIVRSAIEKHVAEIFRIALPIVDQGEHPNDGCSYELTIGHILSGITFRWWGTGPKEWHRLVDATSGILAELENLKTE